MWKKQTGTINISVLYLGKKADDEFILDNETLSFPTVIKEDVKPLYLS